MSRQDGGNGITTTSPVVPAGGTIEVEVHNGATELQVFVHGDPTATRIPVPAGGKVRVPVPASAANGQVITIFDSGVPPASVDVEVVSTE
jgi:hypothetical protein